MNEVSNDVVVMNMYDGSDESNKIQDEKDVEERSKLMAKIEPVSPMQDINKAFEECKFGCFHIRLLFTTFAGCIASVLVNNSTSYLLPIAECDLNMNLREKGLLTAMPYIGMFISSVISGFLVDTFGRIMFLKIGYVGLFLFTLFSAFSQTYEIYAAAKLGEGIMTAIAISGVTSITSEFCHPSVRDRVLLCQISFAAMAQIICPAMAWGILVQNWELSFLDGAFVLKTWNFYIFAMSFWSLTASIMFATIPESPKFLVTQKKYLEARYILVKVYTENTGKLAETFPYPNLWDQEILEGNKPDAPEKAVLKAFQAQVLVGLHNMKPLLQRPLITYLAIIGAMQLAVVGMYNVLRLWFPQLSTIVEHYKLDGNQNLCVLLDSYTATEKLRIYNSTSNNTEMCVPDVSGTETYVNNIIMGLVCMIPYCISGVLVNKVGKKVLLILAGIISTGTLLGIRWSSSKIMMVSLYSVFVAVTQTINGLTQMVLVEVFPTTTRSLAMSLVMSLARAGTLLGNIAFPILLAMGCEIPFYTMTGIMIRTLFLQHVSGTETYINNIIIGLVCMIPYFISGVVVNKVGKKVLLILAGVISTGALLGIRWSNSKTMMVALYSVFVAVTQTMKGLTQMVLVEVFPTTMRTLAMSLVMSCARAGTLLGNITFPILLAMGCEIPFYSMTGMMIGLVVLSMFMPKKK